MIPKMILGWREWLALPDLGVPGVKAKVDTGARTSALHADDVRYVNKGGKQMVRFTIHPFQRSRRGAVRTIAPVVDTRQVRSSSGHHQERPVIVTEVQLDGKRWPIEITLTSRDEMGFRMLLGRQAIRGHAVVDPGRSFLTAESRARRRKKKAKR